MAKPMIGTPVSIQICVIPTANTDCLRVVDKTLGSTKDDDGSGQELELGLALRRRTKQGRQDTVTWKAKASSTNTTTLTISFPFGSPFSISQASASAPKGSSAQVGPLTVLQGAALGRYKYNITFDPGDGTVSFVEDPQLIVDTSDEII